MIEVVELPIVCAWCPPSRKLALPEGVEASHNICPLCKPAYDQQREQLAALFAKQTQAIAHHIESPKP